MVSVRKKPLIYFSSFLLGLMCFFIISIISGNGIWGNNTVLKGDATVQFINFLAYFYDVITGNTRDAFYSFSITPGGDTLLLWAYYLFSPFNFLVLLFGKTALPDAFFWIEAIKISAAAFFMSIFLTHYLERKKVNFSSLNISLILATSMVYAFCGFVSAYTHDIMWFDAVLILPFLVDGILKLALDKKILQYFFCLLYAVITNFYMGFAVCVFSLLFFTYISLLHNMQWKDWIRFIVTSLFSGASSLVILLPAIKQVLISKFADKSDIMFRIDRFMIEILLILFIVITIYMTHYVMHNNLLFNGIKPWLKYFLITMIMVIGMIVLHVVLNRQAWKGNYLSKSIIFPFRFLIGVFDFDEAQSADLMCVYITVFLAGTIVVYLLDYRYTQKKKIIDFISIVVCYFMMGFTDVNYVWHGFTHPAGNFYRWGFILSFFLILIAFDYLIENQLIKDKLSIKKAIYSYSNYCMVLFFFMIFVIAIHKYKQEGYAFIPFGIALLNILFIAIYFVLVVWSKENKMIIYAVPYVMILEVLINAVLSTKGFEYVAYDRYNEYINISKDIMSEIENQNDNDLFRVECDYEPYWYYIANYNSICHYSSAFVRSNHLFLDRFGMAGEYNAWAGEKAQNNFDLSPELAGFLSIRYLVTDKRLEDESYSLLEKYDVGNTKYFLYRNRSALPMTFIADNSAFEVCYDDMDLSSIEEFVRSYVDNDVGLIECGYSKYESDVDCSGDEIVVFSIPFDNEWKIQVDGNDVEPKQAYGYFMAICPGQGKHHIEVKYQNFSLYIGFIISIISLGSFLCVFKRIEG